MKNLQSRIIRLPLVVGGPRAGWSHTRFPSGIGNGGGGWEPPPPPPPPPPGSIAWQPFTSSAMYPWEAAAPPGFTQIPPPHPDARVIHLDAPVSEGGLGNDANSGLSPSQPKATAEAAHALTRQGMGDRVCVHRVQPEHNEWYTHNFRPFQVRNATRGGAPGNRTIITWYGNQGKRPRCIPYENIGSQTYQSHLGLVGIHWVTPPGEIGNPNYSNGDRISLQHINGGTSDLLVEDCELTNVELVPQIQSHAGAKRDFTIRRNIFHYCFHKSSSSSLSIRPSNFYSKDIENLLIEENVFDYGGWYPGVAGANMYNHCLYLSEGNSHPVLIQHNIISRPAGHGWQMRSPGIAHRNIVNRAAVGASMGYYDPNNQTKGIWADHYQGITTENLILKTHSMHRVANSCQNGVCSSARWGQSYTINNPNATWISVGNVMAEVSTEWYGAFGATPGLNSQVEAWVHINAQGGQVYQGFPQAGRDLDQHNNKVWRYANATQNDGIYSDPGRNLESYLDYIAGDPLGTRTFDQAMQHLRGRDTPYAWNESLTPQLFHSYIMAGYELI